VITIDGPAGAGKSTAAQAVARRLRFAYLDSGALYRAIAWAGLGRGLPAADAEALARLRSEVRLTATAAPGSFRVFVDGAEIDAELRLPEVGERASVVATLPTAREWVGETLRELSRQGPCVAEGRDMGSRVFPEARIKIYLTASLEERARRRAAQLRAAGIESGAESVLSDIASRDARDRSREASPLRVPEGAVRIDNTRLSAGEQAEIIAELYRGRGRHRGAWGRRLLQRSLWIAFRALLGVRVIGSDRLPPGGFLLASNHKSYVDPPLLGSAVAGEVKFLAKAELFRVPLVGSFLRSVGALPVRRGAFDKRAVEESIRCLQRGWPLVVFPEGTRTPGPALGRPHPGIGLLARRADVPAVPVRIRGLENGFRPGRGRVTVTIGDPLGMEADEGDRDFAQRVMDAIERL
jgi:cytidylate kinase